MKKSNIKISTRKVGCRSPTNQKNNVLKSKLNKFHLQVFFLKFNFEFSVYKLTELIISKIEK